MSTNIIDKIQALLNQAESTTHEEEADAFFSKAQELMVKHAVDEDALKAAGKKQKDEIVMIDVAIKTGIPGTKPRTTFLLSVSRSMSCQMWLKGQKPPLSGEAVVCGHESDAQFVHMVYMSVQMQLSATILRELKVAKDEHDDPMSDRYGYGDKFREGVWRRNFIAGYLNRVSERIKERYVKADENYGAGTAIVLRNRGLVVSDWVNNRMTLTANTRKSHATYDYNARAHGARVGDRVDISGGRNTLNPQKRLA